MEIFQGTEGFGRVALGKIKIINSSARKSVKNNKFDKNNELLAYDNAKKRVVQILEKERLESSGIVDEKVRWSKKIDSLLMLITDHQLEDAIVGRIISQDMTADKAILDAGRYLEKVLSSQPDEYLRHKGNDIKELSERLLNCLEGYYGNEIIFSEPSIVAAKSLSSAEFLKLDKDYVVGLIVEKTSVNSHTAILAKAMNIPTITGCEIYDDWDGKFACIDGGWRAIYLEPDEQTRADMTERLKEAEEETLRLMSLKGKECVTSFGKKIHLFANIASPNDIEVVKQNDAEGIGLYRTEPAYMNRLTAPSEDELYNEYKAVAMAMGSKGVTIRTVDLGMDREIPYLSNSIENNSAMGCRGIRLCLRHQEIFRTQLKAILRASVYGNISIMFPMICAIKEFKIAKDIVEECLRELMLLDIPAKPVPVGIMIETPAAALISDELAKHAAFMSIGTNDLTQYSLGVDRENETLSDICDYHHPAIMKLVRMVAESGKKAGIPVGICGELAGDEDVTGYLIELGIDSLSIAPGKILPLRNKIIKM